MSGLSGGEACAVVRSRIVSRDCRALVLAAIKHGARIKETKSGVMIYCGGTTLTVHGTVSDHRAVKNLRAGLRRAGLTTLGR